MISQELIAEVIDVQKEVFLKKGTGVERDQLQTIQIHESFVNVITGIRRCGKSTFLRQILKNNFQSALFLNFEDTRLAGFKTDDFRRLDAEITKRKINVLFFDEIQMLENWELYVRQKIDEGFQIIVTGSNATLLSHELGTKLTGRHLSSELFPFSYTEFLKFKKLESSYESVKMYLESGGFPEYLKTNLPTILNQLLDDILYRDIAVRYGVRDIVSLRKLAVYLISNIGKQVSATNLTKLFDIKAVSTMLEYFSHLENTYIVQFVPKFSYSLKAQIRNPKKVYTIDLGLFAHNSVVFTEESGRRLENLVYLHLRRKYKEIYYFSEKKECDFVVIEKEKPRALIQVCYELNEDNLMRELEGTFEVLRFFKEKKAVIVTMNQKDRFEKDGLIVEVISLQELLEGAVV
ncbi:ATP-binding protein [Fluviicola sp.]|jgi:predicted AAA+ superfamily ATPase|uniref:ATP-binding protein n=1 Tax=Fluviicola sp. TaxID=1917219 RepID=UPI00282F5054|nr:ATP-binding protein [Fluviicola sp.]MDR0801289.1 ATP-binding protein [Fluviicola sp.]